MLGLFGKYHYGNCKQDIEELNHTYEKLRTKSKQLEQTLRDNETIIREQATEINELKAIHHYERAQLEKELKELNADFDDMQQKYKHAKEEKRVATAKLLQLEHDMKHNHGDLNIIIEDKPKKKKKKS